MLAAFDRMNLYRFVLWYLAILYLAAAVLAAAGALPYRVSDLGFSLLLIAAACWITNRLFAVAFRAPSQHWSVWITALILAMILTPVGLRDLNGIGFACFAAAWAMASKYMLAVRKRHIFNPAAFGTVLAALALDHSAIWWVGGSLWLMPIIVGGGLVVARKLRGFDVVAAYGVAALAVTAATSAVPWQAMTQMLLHSMFLFFAFVMMTEPRTLPRRQAWRIAYGAIVGGLCAPAVHFGAFYFTPELALVTGNLAVLPARLALRSCQRQPAA